MENKVLVAYATKYGATAEIAKKIGDVLNQAEMQVDVLPADNVSDLSTYEAVILGSAVYIGKWRKEAVKFIKKNEKLLAGKMVWLFSSGPTGEGDPVELLKNWRFPGSLQPIADRIKPRDIVVFHGALDNKKLSTAEKWIIKNVKAPLGDFRDWEAINSWATLISDCIFSD